MRSVAPPWTQPLPAAVVHEETPYCGFASRIRSGEARSARGEEGPTRRWLRKIQKIIFPVPGSPVAGTFSKIFQKKYFTKSSQIQTAARDSLDSAPVQANRTVLDSL
jgi:hypothetical protein